jgi:hypothetical protein
MANRVTFNRNVGMLVLAIYLILAGLGSLTSFALLSPLMPILALVAGILILIGR